MDPLEGVNRFEVIDGTGRALTYHGVSVRLEYQDDGRTLKAFVSDLPAEEAERARNAHRDNLARDLSGIHRRIALDAETTKHPTRED